MKSIYSNLTSLIDSSNLMPTALCNFGAFCCLDRLVFGLAIAQTPRSIYSNGGYKNISLKQILLNILNNEL